MENAEEDVRVANGLFYEAFRRRDLSLMERAWTEGPDALCIHPGASPLRGHATVMESWQRILANPSAPAIECSRVEVTLHGSTAIVICREGVPDQDAALIATNLFVREAAGWRLVHHHASPVVRDLDAPGPDRDLN